MSDQNIPTSEDRLGSIMDINVNLRVVLGVKRMPLGKIIQLGRGSIVEIDRRVGEPVDLYANDRLIARAEVQMSENGQLAVSITEITSPTP